MSKRHEWTFEKTASELAEAAATRASHHSSRHDWWEAERDKVKAEIQGEGLQVRERAVSGGNQHEVVIDPELARRLSLCETKMQSHLHQADEYAGWRLTLKDAGDRSFSLDQSDWVFFFGYIADDAE